MPDTSPQTEPPHPPAEPNAEESARIAARAADDRQGLDITLLYVRELTSVADYFLVVTARSVTQSRAIYEAIDEAMSRAGREPLHIEGKPSYRWVLMDYADVIVHILLPEERDFYGIEKLWSDAPRLTWGEADDSGAP